MKDHGRSITRRTRPCGKEIIDVEETMLSHIGSGFKFSTGDLDEIRERMIYSGPVSIPSGTPDWITENLIKDTIETWQLYSKEKLDSVAAVEILLNISELLDVPIE